MTKRRALMGANGSDMVIETNKWLQALGAEFNFSHKDLYRIELCFDELVTNVVLYSAPRFANQMLELTAVIEAQSATLTLVDPAEPFNPLAHPPPPVAKTLEEMTIGGFGIAFVREFSDAQQYQRINNKNRIDLVFNLEQATDAPPAHDAVACADRTVELLAASPIFRGTPHAQIASLIDGLLIRDIVSEMLLLKSGEANDNVLIVLRGNLKIYFDQPGRGDFVDFGIGECVGEMSVIDDQPVSAFVVAMPGARLLVIDKATFLNVVMAMPSVSRNMLSTLSERMRKSTRLIIKRMRHEIEMEHMQRELQYAQSIQESLLPKAPLFPDEPRLDCVGRMRVVKEVGGDFYDVFMLDAQHVFFVIADVCGKGLPAALYMVRALTALRAQSGSAELTDDALSRLMEKFNHQLCAYNDAQQFLTAFCGILNLETRVLRYVNAGHNAPAIALGGADFHYLSEPINPMVGMVDHLSYQTGEIGFPPGSVLLLYTDGVTEAEDQNQQVFGEERLLTLLNTKRSRSAGQRVEDVFAGVADFAAGAQQSDDIAVLAIRCPAS